MIVTEKHADLSMARYFENPYYRFLQEPIFLLANETSKKKRCPVLRQKPTQILP